MPFQGPPCYTEAMVETQTALLRRLRDPEDTLSWQEFVTLYKPLLERFVAGQGLCGQDVQDVVQDIYIRLLTALPQFALELLGGSGR